MGDSCCDCGCPVDPGANDHRQCRKGRGRLLGNLRPRTDGAGRVQCNAVQCCRCASLPGKESCLFCIEQLRVEAAGGEKQSAKKNKRKASEALKETDQELDAKRKEQEAVRSKQQRVKKTIRDLEEAKERVRDLEPAREAVEASLEEAKKELAETEKDVERVDQQIQKLESNKRQRETEELQATRTLIEMDKVLSPSRHPGYWNLKCDADDAPPT
eukprot:501379-Rhodomonas_salina.1